VKHRGDDSNTERKATYPRWQWLDADGHWVRNCIVSACADNCIAWEGTREKAVKREQPGAKGRVEGRRVCILGKRKPERYSYKGTVCTSETRGAWVSQTTPEAAGLMAFLRRHDYKHMRVTLTVLP
jgi:hypothetical protein